MSTWIELWRAAEERRFLYSLSLESEHHWNILKKRWFQLLPNLTPWAKPSSCEQSLRHWTLTMSPLLCVFMRVSTVLGPMKQGKKIQLIVSCRCTRHTAPRLCQEVRWDLLDKHTYWHIIVCAHSSLSFWHNWLILTHFNMSLVCLSLVSCVNDSSCCLIQPSFFTPTVS